MKEPQEIAQAKKQPTIQTKHEQLMQDIGRLLAAADDTKLHRLLQFMNGYLS